MKKKREITYIWKYDNAVTNWIKSRVKLAKHYFSKKIASLQIWNASLHKSILCPTKTFKPRFIWFQYLLSFSNSENFMEKWDRVYEQNIKHLSEKSTTRNQRNKMLIIVFDIFLMRMTTKICFDTKKIRLALKSFE